MWRQAQAAWKRLCSHCFGHMEEEMFKCLVTITGALVLVAAAVLISGRAEAGASASAPSKYSRANQLASQQAQTNRQAGRNDFGITEYSSSSARNRSH
jgi:hypothetical protein